MWRFEITSILQRELSQRAELFGTLQKGTPADPAVRKESVHHFSKIVAGAPWEDLRDYFVLLGVFDIVALLGGLGMFGALVDE